MRLSVNRNFHNKDTDNKQYYSVGFETVEVDADGLMDFTSPDSTSAHANAEGYSC